jgi:hypothetical protein
MNGSPERKLYEIGIAGYVFFPDRIRILPDMLSEWSGEKTIEIPIAPHSDEVLICVYSMSWANGGSMEIIFRSKDGEEHRNHIPYFTSLTRRGAQKLAQAITAETSLPVRLVIRGHDADGKIRDLPWEPFFRNSYRLPLTLMFASLLIPFVGGVLVGYACLSLSVVIYLGVLLWALQILSALIVWARNKDKRNESYPLPVLLFVTTVTFVSTYSLTTMIGVIIPRLH